MLDSSESPPSGSHGFLLEASEEGWMKKARELITPLLDEAARVQAFRGRWMMICMRLQRLSEALDSVCESAPLHQSFLHHKSALPQIVACLVEGRELARRSTDLSYGGKLLMQSNLDALVTKLDYNLRDLDEVQNGIKQSERTVAITAAIAGDRRDPGGINPRENHRKEQVWDMFAKLKAGNADTKKLALGSLIDYMCKDDKATLLVADEGDVHQLVHLLDSSSAGIREMAAHAVSTMATVDECKKALISEGAIQPLLRILDSGNMRAKEKAALALFELTRIPENAHAVASQAGAVALLVKLCKQGIHPVVMGTVGTLCNLARNEHIRRALAENGAIDALVSLVSCSSSHARHHAAKALQNLASGKDDRIRTSIMMHGGMHSLLAFLEQATSAETQEIAIQALSKLVTSPKNVKALVSAGYAMQLTELLNTGSPSVQHLAALAIRDLASYIDLKRTAFPIPLVRVLEAKDLSEYRVLAQALSNTLPGKGHHHKEDTRILGFWSYLNACKHSLTKKLSTSALFAHSGYKNRIMSAEAGQPQFGKMSEVNVIGPNKAVQRLGGKRLLGVFSRRRKPPPLSSSSLP